LKISCVKAEKNEQYRTTIRIEMLKELDALYEETEDMGSLGRRPTRWGTLVEELRKIRRLVEAGITVKIEGTQMVLNSWKSFYDWRTDVTTRSRTAMTVG
jgi:hypothetical protein